MTSPDKKKNNLEEHVYFIYEKDKIVGYTTSWREADDICQKYKNLLWDSSHEYSQDLKKVQQLCDTLEQLTIGIEINFD